MSRDRWLAARNSEERAREVGFECDFFTGYIKVSNEQNPGCLGYARDEILPNYIGIIINRYIRILHNIVKLILTHSMHGVFTYMNG